MFTMNCAECGGISRLDLWIETALGQQRPREHYQCPLCHKGFMREHSPASVIRIGEGEMVVPGKVTLKTVPTVHKYDD